MGAVLAALVRGGLPPRWSFGLDLREGEGHGVRVADAGEGVDPGAAGIAEAEELGDLVVGFAGGVVDGAADEGVGPGAVGGAGEIEMGVAAGDDEGEGGLTLALSRVLALPPFPNPFGRTAERMGHRNARCGLALVEQDGVDVAFEVVDGDEGEIVARRRGPWRR